MTRKRVKIVWTRSRRCSRRCSAQKICLSFSTVYLVHCSLVVWKFKDTFISVYTHNYIHMLSSPKAQTFFLMEEVWKEDFSKSPSCLEVFKHPPLRVSDAFWKWKINEARKTSLKIRLHRFDIPTIGPNYLKQPQLKLTSPMAKLSTFWDYIFSRENKAQTFNFWVHWPSENMIIRITTRWFQSGCFFFSILFWKQHWCYFASVIVPHKVGPLPGYK